MRLGTEGFCQGGAEEGNVSMCCRNLKPIFAQMWVARKTQKHFFSSRAERLQMEKEGSKRSPEQNISFSWQKHTHHPGWRAERLISDLSGFLPWKTHQ